MRETRRWPATPEAIAEAGAMLRAGGLVAFPTETVYGLGADATADIAVADIYAAKTRPSFNPLIAHLAEPQAAFAEGDFPAVARHLAEAFWPGPLTLVVPVAPGGTVCALARAGLDSVALRVPAHPVARALIAAAGRPVVAPSANRSGKVSPTSADHVLQDLDGRIDVVLDAGETSVGVESTIVACLDAAPVLLRPGGVTRDALERALGQALSAALPREGAVVAPGMLAAHYAPRAALRLHARHMRPGEAGLDFGGCFLGRAPGEGACLDLSPGGDLRQAAANLFAYLRALDATGARTIAVAAVPAHGLGEAINDRLARAAAPRDDAPSAAC